jgi:hypothetical protein
VRETAGLGQVAPCRWVWSSASASLYTFAIMLWMSNQAAGGDQLLISTYQEADTYLAGADQTLARLDRQLS